MVDRIVDLAVRYRLPIGIVAGLWFWTGCAVYAGFLELPAIPQWAQDGYFWSAVAGNATWWAYLGPKVIARREELDQSRGD